MQSQGCMDRWRVAALVGEGRMSELNSREFYLRREHEERILADAAQDPDIRKIHAEMAEEYAQLAARVLATSAGRRAAPGARTGGPSDEARV